MKNVNILVKTKRIIVAEFKKAAAKFTKSKSSADRLVRAIIAGRKVSISKGFKSVMWRFVDVIAAIEGSRVRTA